MTTEQQPAEQPKNVHTEHCCRKHGCKYGDDDCPVELGIQAQSFPCESCEMEPADQDPGMGEDAKAVLWREWAIDGMPKDKQRLAEAAFAAGLAAIAALSQPKEEPDGLTEMTSLIQCKDSWLAVVALLDRKIPEWRHTRGTGQEKALAAIEALSLPRQSEATAWAFREGGILADWCNVAGAAIRDLMAAYERRVRSSCTTPEDLAAQPWRCAEYVQAEEALRFKPSPFVSVETATTPPAAQGDGELTAWRELSLACSIPGGIVWPNSWPQDVAVVAHLIWTLQTKDTTPAAHGVDLPEGWLSAPLEPTAEMIRRGTLFGDGPNAVTIIFQEMLQAASAPGGSDG